MFKQSKHRQQDPEAGQRLRHDRASDATTRADEDTQANQDATTRADQDAPARPLRRIRIALSSVACGVLSACNCQTTTQAIDATSKRRAMAGPVSCCHCSSCWPWLLSNLK